MKQLFLIAAISTLLFSCKKSATDPIFPADLEKFYFAGTPSSSSGQQIFYNNGMGETQLTNYPGGVAGTVSNWCPRLTADGKKIFFSSSKDDQNGEIFYMNVDGSNLVKAVSHSIAGGTLRDISLYQNGQKIIFNQEFGTFPGRYSQIFRVNNDGTGLTALTDVAADGSCYDPWVNESGTLIAYSCQTSSGRKIYTMSTDGSNKHILTGAGPGDQLHPQISPDGSKVVFEGWWPPYASDIFIADVNGTNLKQLSNYSANGSISNKYSLSPTFSKDGNKIYYSSNSNPTFYGQVSRMNIDGTNNVQLSGSNFTKYNPVVN